MIDTYSAVRTAYYTALNGNVTVTLPVAGSTVIPVYSHVPDSADYPYIFLGNQIDSGGDDVLTRTKDNRYATEHLIEIYAVTGFRTADDNGSYKVADDIANEILQIVLADTPLTITGVENVTTNYDSGTYEVERNETHLVISRQIVMRHTLSQN